MRPKVWKKVRWLFVVSPAIVFFGCLTNDSDIIWNPPGGWGGDAAVTALFKEGRYDESFKEAEGAWSENGSDRILWQMEMISNLLLNGEKDAAHKRMMLAREDVELLFDERAESRAMSLWYKEGEKPFKGDGWERATLYALLALSFIDRGDWTNAIRCAKKGLLCDSDSQNKEANGDYALLPYLGYIAAQRAGKDAESRAFMTQYRSIVGAEIPQMAQTPDSLLVLWVGEGVTYRLDGEYAQRRKVVEGAIEGRLESVSVAASDGRMWFSLPPGIADLNAQAMGRGPRMMDRVLEDKVTTKETLANVGNGLLTASAAMMVVGTADFRLAIILYPTAAATALLAGGAMIGSSAVETTADARIWSCLPGRLLVVPVSGGEGQMQLTGYMGWDEVYKGDVGVPARSPCKVSVCHKSLLPERLEIHANWKRQVLDSVDKLITDMQLPENEKKMEIR